MVLDSSLALPTRVKKVHFKRRAENLRERRQLLWDQRRRISIHGDHRVVSDEEKGGGRLNRSHSKIVRFFSKEIIERLASSMGEEAVKRSDPLPHSIREFGSGQKRNPSRMIRWDLHM